MTRIAAGLDQLRGIDRAPVREGQWWSEAFNHTKDVWHVPLTSDVVPDGSVIREVQIHAAMNNLTDLIDTMVYLRIVSDENPTVAAVFAGETVIDWRWLKVGMVWVAINQGTNEVYRCCKVVRGANLRFAVTAHTAHAVGGVVRASVFYELP